MRKKYNNNQIKQLNDQLKTIKSANKELEKKFQVDNADYSKQHQYFVDLQDKYRKLQETINAKKNLVDKNPLDLPNEENSGAKK